MKAVANPSVPMVPLGDVCQIANGTTPASGESAYWHGEVVWITPTDLGQLDATYIKSSARRISAHALDTHNLTLCPPGTVVLSSRAPIGHLGIAATPLCTNQGCKALVPGNGLKSEFLYYAMRFAVPELQAMGSGATFPEISKSQVERFEIPFPPLPEQERIAARLTEQLAAVEQARVAALDRLAAAEALPAAYLREVFEGPEASGWEVLHLGDTCDLLASKSISTAGETVVCTVTTACLSESGFRPAGIKTARMRAADVPECLLRPGEVLVARSNTPELVGRAAIYKGNPPGIVANDLTIRVWPHEYISADYLAAFLSYLFLTGYWKERAGGASGTMKKITRHQLLALPLPFPSTNTHFDSRQSLDDQRVIVANLSRRIAEAARLTAILREELAAIEALPATLLRTAFNGNQHPQGD